MRRVSSIAVAAVLAVGLFSQAALAASPHFLKASATRSGNNLVVSFKEAGLGNQVVRITVSATATETDHCVNKGGNVPSDPKKTTQTTRTSTSGVFQPRNGSITGSLTITPPGTNLICPKGQHAEFVSVTYTNVMVNDTSNGISRSVAGTF